MLISVIFRGEEVDVDVTRQREPYEWTFFGKSSDEVNAMNVTAAEDEAICIIIAETLWDRASTDNPFEH